VDRALGGVLAALDGEAFDEVLVVRGFSRMDIFRFSRKRNTYGSAN